MDMAERMKKLYLKKYAKDPKIDGLKALSMKFWELWVVYKATGHVPMWARFDRDCRKGANEAIRRFV
jgi:hypothetical protein